MDVNLITHGLLFLDRGAIAVLFAISISGILAAKSADTVHAAPLLHRAALASLITLVITTTFVLLLRTAALADVGLLETWPHLGTVIQKSLFGATWVGRACALLAAIALYFAFHRRGSSLSNGSLLVACISIAFFISGASHAGENGLFAWENINNTLHILSASAWGGSVLLYALLVRKLHSAQWAISDTAHRLTLIATIALATVLVTGVINAWLRLASLDVLWTTDYGLVLLGKLVFVLIMMAVGATNRFFLIPALCREETQGVTSSKPHTRFRRGLYLDSVVFLVIIALAVILATLSPEHY